MSVGDINGTERGSGARFNTGKPAMDLIPLRHIARQWLVDHPDRSDLADAMLCLGMFQETGEEGQLFCLVRILGEPWEDCAKVFAYGREKYAAWNWSRGMAWSIPLACAARHLMAMARGEVLDPESGLDHRGHILCNLVMLMTFADTFKEGNDLPVKELGYAA